MNYFGMYYGYRNIVLLSLCRCISIIKGNMKVRWSIGWNRLKEAVRKNPMEVLLSFFFCLLGCYCYDSWTDKLVTVLYYAPALFLITNMLNRLTTGKWRLLYGLSAFLFVLIHEGGFEQMSSFYIVTMVVVQLLFVVSYRIRDDRNFISLVAHYLIAGTSAVLLAAVIYLAFNLIYYSAEALFDIGYGYYSCFSTYTASFAFFGVMPLLFLLFYQPDKTTFKGGRLFDVLINFILSPALMVYTVILYLYIIMIIAQWSLPKGTVAMIVIGYTLVSFVLNACQPFLSKRYYDWYFRRISCWVLPTLLMFWVGTFYRILQYGFTEPRVYLVVVGLILTAAALHFLSQQSTRYYYVFCFSLVALSVVTYIPGLTAKDIERISQEERAVDTGKRVTVIDYAINRETPVQLEGYSKAWPVSQIQKEGVYTLSDDDEQLRLYDAKGNLCLDLPLESFWQSQLNKVHLSQEDTIPASVYSDLLQYETEYGLLLFESMTVRHDSISHLHWVSPWIFLER